LLILEKKSPQINKVRGGQGDERRVNLEEDTDHLTASEASLRHGFAYVTTALQI
jgi:hypothetical protein